MTGKYYGYNNKSTEFNDWIRFCCKEPSDGLLVSDLDFIFIDYKKKKLKLIEVKTYNAQIKFWQENIYKTLDKSLKSSCDEYDYEGFYTITMSRSNPEISDIIKINEKIVSRDVLVDFLNFDKKFEDIDSF
jgi:hypothetical protein